MRRGCGREDRTDGRHVRRAGPKRSRRPSQARMRQPVRARSAYDWKYGRREFLDRALQRFVLGVLLDRIRPELARFFLAPGLPKHFAEVRRDLTVWTKRVRALQP